MLPRTEQMLCNPVPTVSTQLGRNTGSHNQDQNLTGSVPSSIRNKTAQRHGKLNITLEHWCNPTGAYYNTPYPVSPVFRSWAIWTVTLVPITKTQWPWYPSSTSRRKSYSRPERTFREPGHTSTEQGSVEVRSRVMWLTL